MPFFVNFPTIFRVLGILLGALVFGFQAPRGYGLWMACSIFGFAAVFSIVYAWYQKENLWAGDVSRYDEAMMFLALALMGYHFL